MNAKQIYNQAYSDRRAVSSGRMTPEQFERKYSQSEIATVMSCKAVSSFVNNKRGQYIQWHNGKVYSKWLRLRRVYALANWY